LPPLPGLTTDLATGDHPSATICRSENWAVQQINAVMKSLFWKSTDNSQTAILFGG
jgi:hypothetical protein